MRRSLYVVYLHRLGQSNVARQDPFPGSRGREAGGRSGQKGQRQKRMWLGHVELDHGTAEQVTFLLGLGEER